MSPLYLVAVADVTIVPFTKYTHYTSYIILTNLT